MNRNDVVIYIYNEAHSTSTSRVLVLYDRYLRTLVCAVISLIRSKLRTIIYFFIIIIFFFFFSFTLYLAHSRASRGYLLFRPTQLPLRRFRSRLLTEFCRQRVLSGETRYQDEEIKIMYILFSLVRIEPTTCHVYSHTLVSIRHDWPHNMMIGNIISIYLNLSPEVCWVDNITSHCVSLKAG